MTKRRNSRLNYNYSHVINTRCSNVKEKRDETWYKESYRIILELYELVKNGLASPDYVYPRISHIANCMVNGHNWIMNADEITKTIKTLDFENDFDHTMNTYLYDQIGRFKEILYDLSKYKKYSNRDLSSIPHN